MSQKNKIYDLTQRAQKAYAETMKTCNFNPMKPLQLNDINWIERELKVCFSDDFISINQVFDYEYLGDFDFNTFYYNGHSGVMKKTQKFRQEVNLPNRYVILSYTGDTRFVLMETQDTPDKNTPILDIEPEDLDNLIENKPLEYDHTIWPSFTDFFEYLVEQEEESVKSK